MQHTQTGSIAALAEAIDALRREGNGLVSVVRGGGFALAAFGPDRVVTDIGGAMPAVVHVLRESVEEVDLEGDASGEALAEALAEAIRARADRIAEAILRERGTR